MCSGTNVQYGAYMVQDAGDQNCWWRLRYRLNVSSESASTTTCGRALQAGMVRGRSACLNASTAGWKCWNCLGWPLAVCSRRGTGWYYCGTSPSPLVTLYIMASMLWSLLEFPSEIRHHRRYGNGRFAASKGNVLHKSGCSALSHFQLINISLLMWIADAGTVFELGMDDSFVSLFLQVLRTPIQIMFKKAQRLVCDSADLINVLIPRKSVVYCDS